jgi:YHS domain-containing protein
MLRTIVYLLATVLMITFIRGVIGLITKAMGDLFRAESQQARKPSAQAPGIGGELIQDPVCGMYVSPKVARQKTVEGKIHYFCSDKCRDSFPLQKA